MKDKIIRILKYFGMFLAPIAMYYLMESFQMNAFSLTRPKAQILNIIFFELIMLFLYVLIGRLRIALIIETAFAFLAGLANFYVVSFRSNPIVPWDLLSVKTASSVAGTYDYSLGKRQILTIIAFVILIIIELFLNLNLKKLKLRFRIISFAASVAVICLFTKMLQTDSFVNQMELYPFLFTPAYMAQADGFAVSFLMDLQYMSVQKPNGYNKDEAQALLDNYKTSDESKTTASTDTDTSATAKQMPNIIVVMDEAFSDLDVLGDFSTNTDYMPFMHSLEQGTENTVTGNLNVSVKGGNTANTEFEFLTGNTMAFLPSGSIPYQQYISGKIPSLVSYLSGLGYTTYGMHPYYASGWNRDKVYPYLGFSNLSFMDDYSSPTYVRDYISDDSCVDKIIDTYENKPKDSPMFLFNVTIQNHSPYYQSYYNFNENVTAQGNYSESLNQYLSLIKLSDASLEKLITYFKAQSQPTVIVFFGDHQPSDVVAEPVLEENGMTYNTLTNEEQQKRYEVPYVIWANYSIESGKNEDTSANYLAAKVLDKAGVPLSSYENYLLQLSQKIPIISAETIKNKSGNDISLKDNNSLLDIYQKIQYYRLFDASEGENK